MDERLRPESSSRRSPASPGKRRMVDNTKVRYISRGLPDSDEEDLIITQPQAPRTVPPPNPTLNLTTSRKRKTLDLSTSEQSVLVLPSPTTQIARQIDSIRLVGTPVYGHTNRLPMLGLADNTAGTSTSHLPAGPLPRDSSTDVGNKMETSSSPSIGHKDVQMVINKIEPTSPHHVPPIGTSVDVSDDCVAMETYLQRPQHALNMKRTLSDEDSGRHRVEELDQEERLGKGGQRDKMIKYSSHASPRSNSTTPPIKVSTIIQSPTKSALSPSSSSTDKYAHTPSSSSVGFVAVPMSTAGSTLSPVPSTSSPTPHSSTPSPISKPPPSKVSNFSISELLAKDDSKSKSSHKPVIPQPITTTTPVTTPVPPAFLSFYYQQQWYMQMLSNMKKFQGEPVEVDSASPTTGGVGGGASTSSLTILSGQNDKPAAGHLRTTSTSPSSSITSTSTDPPPPSGSTDSSRGENQPTQEEGRSSRGGVNPSSTSSTTTSDTTTNENGPFNQRQNALLQVGEAHLAILPDEDGDTPLHLSIIQENIPLTFYLVRLISGVRMNLDIANNLRQTPLHLSVITRQPMITQLLVQNGASVNFPDRRGNTCVHLAAQRKNLDALQILAQANSPIPDFNCKNFAGLTPVHIATKEGSVEVLKFLFQMGANKNCADSCSGRTPLHYAVESQNFQVCNYLLESGCNVNAITFSGNTPLHVAAGRRLKDIVAVLMAYGANPAIANGEGDFPSDLPASLLVGRRPRVICL